jgi:hypothetical protein
MGQLGGFGSKGVERARWFDSRLMTITQILLYLMAGLNKESLIKIKAMELCSYFQGVSYLIITN